jgi:hypothetical protein
MTEVMFDDLKGCGRMLLWPYQGDIDEGLRKLAKISLLG